MAEFQLYLVRLGIAVECNVRHRNASLVTLAFRKYCMIYQNGYNMHASRERKNKDFFLKNFDSRQNFRAQSQPGFSKNSGYLEQHPSGCQSKNTI